MTITVRDTIGGPLAPIPQDWTPAPCPDLTVEPWHGVPVPWRTPIVDAPVDVERSRVLARVDVPIEVSAPGRLWEGSVPGIPFHRVSVGDKVDLVNVLDRSRPAVTRWQFPRWPWLVVEPPTVALDLPRVLRREGDPVGAWDRHALILDDRRKQLVELIQAESFPVWSAGYDGGGPGVAVWDLTRPWDAPGQPRGVIAGAFPMLPHLLRHDEIANGRVNHALFLVLPNYSPGTTGYARSSDGTDPQHPCRAGERLRLRPEILSRFPIGTPARVVADGLVTFGATVGDRNAHTTSTARSAAITATQDPRFRPLGLDQLGLRLSDFDIVQP